MTDHDHSDEIKTLNTLISTTIDSATAMRIRPGTPRMNDSAKSFATRQ